MSDNTIRVTDLDFADIKQNLINYLSSQTNLKDYNFEGSALSTLVNLLAYNTHYNAIIANMSGNEMFLDSAVSRASIVSHAKTLNYTPRSKKSATAIVNITVRNVPGNPGSITLPKNTKFSTSIDGKTYAFITNSSYIAPNVSGTYVFENVVLYEGVLTTATFVVNQSQNFYTIPTQLVDISTISVLVQNGSSDLTVTPYTRCTDITTYGPDDTIFFVQGHDQYQYQVYFGDNIIGKRPVEGNIVIIEYIATSGSVGNNAAVFGRYAGTTIANSSDIVITTITKSFGGTDAETDEEIKFNAPLAFTAQNRMVTASDYKILLQQEYSNIKSISVWGGEDNNPPEYGTVYICIEPIASEVLTDVEKQNILSYIVKSKKIIGIRPKIVDPKYLYIKISSTVYYNSTKTSLNQQQLSTLVYNTIVNYNNQYLQKFDGVFRYSALSAMIDKSDPSIVSNITNISMHQYLVPTYNKPTSYIIDFYNPIYQNEFKTPENSFRSSRGFRIVGDSKTYFFEDDGEQYIRLFYYDGSTKIYHSNNIGSIDYKTGRIIIDTIAIGSIDLVSDTDPGLELIAVPISNDIIPIMNMIIKINNSDITTSALVDPISSGYNYSSNYVFTESR